MTLNLLCNVYSKHSSKFHFWICVILKYGTFYLHGDFYSRKVSNMTVWQSVIGMPSLLFSDQLTRPQLGLYKLLKNTSRTILMGIFQLSLGGGKKKERSLEINLYSRSFGRKPVISFSPIEPLWGKRPSQIPWIWSDCWNYSQTILSSTMQGSLTFEKSGVTFIMI